MAKNQDSVWPRPKKEENDARVQKNVPKDYDKNWKSDLKDGKNPKNLNS